jgi:glycosyltransferase involved in cell wall biosynthesis
MSSPSVSVIMMTYNHEDFIEQAMQSVLRQQGDYKLTLVISDDSSTDKTPEFIERQIQNYSGPHRINYLRNKKNIGSEKNFFLAFLRCQSEYIALCEGDDYWINDKKLAKQIHFLEANQDYSLSFHRIFFNTNNVIEPVSFHSSWTDEQCFDIYDLAKGNFIPNVSAVFRNQRKLPSVISKAPLGDYCMHLFTAGYGRIKFHPDYMAVYRVHPMGIFSAVGRRQQLQKTALTLRLLMRQSNDNEKLKAVLRLQYKDVTRQLQQLNLQKQSTFNFLKLRLFLKSIWKEQFHRKAESK